MKSLNVAIIGGSAAREQYGEALKYLPHFQISGLIDTDKRAFRAWSDIRPSRLSVYNDVAALKAAHPETELVLLSASQQKRSLYIAPSIAEGLHVLSDAPFASTLIETDSLLHTAARISVAVSPIFTHRFNPFIIAFHTAVGAKLVIPLPSARAEHRLSLEHIGQFGESLKEMAVSIAVGSLDWGRWCFGEALSVSADLHPLLISEQEGISVRGARNSQIATILVQYERANCTHQISIAHGQTGIEKYQYISEEGTLDLAFQPLNSPGGLPRMQWLKKNGDAEQISVPMPASDFDFTPNQTRIYQMLESLTDHWLAEDKEQISACARLAQEIYVAAVISSRSQSRVRLPLIGSGNVKI